jgi:hypothetical protein
MSSPQSENGEVRGSNGAETRGKPLLSLLSQVCGSSSGSLVERDEAVELRAGSARAGC